VREIDAIGAPGPRPAIVRLRIAMAAAGAAASALSLPTQACTAAFGEPDRLWLGPDEWLLLSMSRTAAELIELCTARLDGLRHHAVDASAALERIALQGDHVRPLLSMGCGLDFDIGQFAVGGCMRTRFARIPIVILARATQRFELLYDRSYRAYLTQWLTRAASDPLIADAGGVGTPARPRRSEGS